MYFRFFHRSLLQQLMCSNFWSSAVKYADKKRRLEISRDGSRNQVGSPSPPLPPPPKRVRAVLTGLVSFAMYFRFFLPGLKLFKSLYGYTS
jgi:hypothetical protein